MSEDDKNIAALKRERAGYVARGLTDRVQQVDKQLAALGTSADVEVAVDPDDAPKGRRSKPTETA